MGRGVSDTRDHTGPAVQCAGRCVAWLTHACASVCPCTNVYSGGVLVVARCVHVILGMATDVVNAFA
jgi:hypothetical protein